MKTGLTSLTYDFYSTQMSEGAPTCFKTYLGYILASWMEWMDEFLFIFCKNI